MSNNILSLLRDPSRHINGFCFACGEHATFHYQEVLPAQLITTWGLNSRETSWFNKRESLYCSNCSNSLRTRQLARALVDVYGKRDVSLKELAKRDYFQTLKIAEINMAGSLHGFIAGLPNLSYSEYSPSTETVRHENLEHLSYESNTFDLVITTDTLEHVPDVTKALSEIRRVLKKGGHHIFTIPVLLNKKTKTRANIDEGKINHLAPPSFHGVSDNMDYLVFTEFGNDSTKIIDSVGFKTKLFYLNPIKKRPYFVFVSVKKYNNKSAL